MKTLGFDKIAGSDFEQDRIAILAPKGRGPWMGRVILVPLPSGFRAAFSSSGIYRKMQPGSLHYAKAPNQ